MAGEGIEPAVDAFESVLSGSDLTTSPKTGMRETLNVETMFDGLGEIENPDEEAGGDFEEQPKPKKAKKKEVEEDDEEDDEEVGPDEEEEEEEEDGEEEDEEEEDAEGVEGAELDKKVKVKVDGEDQEVTLREALDGYIRTATFHQRLNKVAEAANVVETEAQKVAAQRDRYATLLDSLTEQLDLIVPKKPDFDKLAETDPKMAYEARKQWEKFDTERAAIEAEKKRVSEERTAEEQRNLQNYVRAERQKMLQKYPQWNDDKIRVKDHTSMARTAKAVGFTDQEISTLYDSRMMEVLLKASKYDRIMASKPKAKAPGEAQGKKTVKPGTGASRTVPKGNVQAQRRLARTGTVDAAVPVFQSLISRG